MSCGKGLTMRQGSALAMVCISAWPNAGRGSGVTGSARPRACMSAISASPWAMVSTIRERSMPSTWPTTFQACR